MAIVKHSEEQKYSYADYLTWKDDQRWEIISGEPMLMSPAPNRAHQTILKRLALQIEPNMRDKSCELFLSPFDVRLEAPETSNDKIHHVVQPDLLVVCDPAKLNSRGCAGAPDWIIEIASPSTASKDHILKREIYERFGVIEYWIVQPLDRLIVVYHLGSDNRYGKPAVYSDSDIVTAGILPDIQIDLNQIFMDIE